MTRDVPGNALGAAYMTLGSTLAVVNDGLVRLATEDGLDVFQALFLRGCGMVIIFIAAGRIRGDQLDLSQLAAVSGCHYGSTL